MMKCTICQDRLFGLVGDKTQLKVTQCGHVFHSVCFDDAAHHK